MKIVINTCYGGFGLSPAGIRRMAELAGRPCYFFKIKRPGIMKAKVYTLITEAEADKEFMSDAFDIPNPNEVFSKVAWTKMTDKERKEENELYYKHVLTSRPENRTDANLVKAVEELGEAANGKYASLTVVEIPDDVEYEIKDYDGVETIHEAHRSWG